MKHKLIYFILLILIMTACRPISRGPNPYTRGGQVPSPLARGMESPLTVPIQQPAIGDSRMLIAPLSELRAGTVPLVGFKPVAWLPFMMHQPLPVFYPCGMDKQANALYELMVSDPDQKRTDPHCDRVVAAVAYNRALDMAKRQYFNHVDPDGYGPNHWLRVARCLPDPYPPNGNSTESITLNYFDAKDAWAALVRSNPHEAHVRGSHPFWAGHNLIGVGWYASDWGGVFVILSTEKCD